MGRSALLRGILSIMMMTSLYLHPVSSENTFNDSQYVLETTEVFVDGISIRVTQKPDVNISVTSIELQHMKYEVGVEDWSDGVSSSWTGESPINLTLHGLKAKAKYDFRVLLHDSRGETFESADFEVETLCRVVSENEITVTLKETSLLFNWTIPRGGCSLNKYRFQIHPPGQTDHHSKSISTLPKEVVHLLPETDYTLDITTKDGRVKISKLVTTLRHPINESKFVHRGDKRYFFYPYNIMSWHLANQYCKSQGMELVTIESAEENEFVCREGEKQAAWFMFWIGAHKEDMNGTWVWSSNGQNVTFNAWGEHGLDNTLGNEKCTYLVPYHNLTANWYDYQCDAKLFQFICQKYVVPWL